MKILHLMRHAKSSWKEPGLVDRDRALNKRGKRDAPRMGAVLSTLVAAPQLAVPLIYVSPARRAQLTLAGLCKGWPELADRQHRTEEDLYTFSSGEVFNWIRSRSEQGDSLFLIGHNPALTELVNELVGTWCLDNLPTAGYARLSLGIDRWSQLQRGCGELELTLFPRELPES